MKSLQTGYYAGFNRGLSGIIGLGKPRQINGFGAVDKLYLSKK